MALSDLNHLQNTAHEQSVQCFLDGINILYVSSANDFTIVPGKYQTFAQKERAERKLEKILLIQRNWRRWILWKYIRLRAKEYRLVEILQYIFY